MRLNCTHTGELTVLFQK